jgi:hypothetical protein
MSPESNSRPRARIEHVGAGRVRARVKREARSTPAMAELQVKLGQHAAVGRVEVNPQSGSVLVFGADARELKSALYQFLDLVEEAGPSGMDTVGVEVAVGLVGEIDRKLRRHTGGWVSLRWAVPASFIALGLKQLLRQGFTVGAVPWYVLLYYGVDSFLKLYPEHAPVSTGRARAAVATPPREGRRRSAGPRAEASPR